MERARRFYVDGLGWPASSASTGDIVFIQLGALGLALYPEQDFAEEIGIAGKWTTPGIVLAQNVRSPEEVAEVLAQAEAAGGRILKPAHKAFWGGTSGYFADPDGHHWEVAHNPSSPSPPMAPCSYPRLIFNIIF
ncbi:MAG: VOC family protein [Geminicoccaceae bacterium]